MATPRVCGNPFCPQSPGSTPTLQLCSRCRTTRYCSQACQAAAWPSHKQACRRQNYTLKVQVRPGHIADPPVVRTLLCPADASFLLLHAALQVAFGWAATHSFDFAVKDPAYVEPADPLAAYMRQSMKLAGRDVRTAMCNDESDPREYVLRLTDPLQGEGQPGPGFGAPVDKMHEARRRHPRTVEKNSEKWPLWKLFDNAEYQGKEIVYTYDFGDNWEHSITVEGRSDATDHFFCLSGTGHPVAEDVGGTQGWAALKVAYRAEQPTNEQREKREWFENHASNADPAGLAGDRVHAWDVDRVNRKLRTMYDGFVRPAGLARN